MAKKTNRKLSLKKETVRALSTLELSNVAGGGINNTLRYCGGGADSGGSCGSVPSVDVCLDIEGGAWVWKN